MHKALTEEENIKLIEKLELFECLQVQEPKELVEYEELCEYEEEMNQLLEQVETKSKNEKADSKVYSKSLCSRR